MADAKTEARKKVRKAQAEFTRTQDRLGQVAKVRRQSFEEAKEAGLSLRDIAKEAGVHFTRVAQILRGE